MMNNTENMFWKEINGIKRFTENTNENKKKDARKTSAIILASVQLMENFIKGIKQMKAYDAASTIYCDASWIKKSTFDCFIDDNGKKVPIIVGKTYYIDYGKTFKGELAYFHHGLCIGKRDGKVLIVPITSGTNYFHKCFHPINNPKYNKKYRQGLLKEGFEKDCVLYINDTKFISAGRIDKEGVAINHDTLLNIQQLVLQVEFPSIWQKCNQDKIKLDKYQKIMQDQKEVISKLKNENNRLTQLLKNSVDK